MKRISALVVGLFMAGAVQAQSYMVRSNGVILNVDNQGFVYDNNQFSLPYMIRVKGGQFYINDKRQITTLDEKGFFYRLDPEEFEAPKKVSFHGYNYFAESDGTIWSIDRQGLLYKGDSNRSFKRPILTGGTYFVVEGGRREPAKFIVVTDRAQVVEVKVPDLDPTKIKDGGNNWFVDSNGNLFTLSREGFVFNKTEIVGKIMNIKSKGGVFFVADEKLYTIAEDGMISDRGAMTSFGTISKSGHNYFLTQDAKMFTIDRNGEVFERTSSFDFSNIALTTF